MAENEGNFLEHLKVFSWHKDELETQSEKALELASTKEELIKLSDRAKKLEKHLKGVQEDIGKKLYMLDPKSKNQVENDVVVLSAEQAGAASKDPNGNDQVNQPKNDSQVAVDKFVQCRSSSSSTTKPAFNSQENLDKENVRQGNLDRTAYNVQQHSPDRTSNNNNSVLIAPSARNNPGPDNTKIFIPNIGQLSEQHTVCMRKYFERFGQVEEVIKKQYANKPPTAIVRFSHPSPVQKVLETVAHIIEQSTVYPIAFNSTPEAAKLRAEMKQSRLQMTFLPRYQVYCGGIPRSASHNDVKMALSEHIRGKIRDIHMPLVDGTTKQIRGFAYVDYERDADADYICRKHFVDICGKWVECKPNQRPMPPYIKSGVNAMSLADSLPNVPPVSSQRPALRLQNEQRATLTLRNGEKQDKCIICRIRSKNCTFMWCNHTETCMDCGKQLTNCPVSDCNKPIHSTIDRSELAGTGNR